MQSYGVNVPQDQQIRFRSKPRAPVPAGTKLEPSPNARALRPAEPGLLKDPNLRFAFGRWSPSLTVAFRFLVLIRWTSGMYTAIADCDEVFNYWEPLHYLVTGRGFQTWEYSPLFAIRSYFYLFVHSGPAVALRAVGFPDKRVIFFGTRLLLASFSSFVEAVFYRSCHVHVSTHVGRYVLWIQMFSAAFYSSATSFLPSTFAMYFVMLGTAASLSPVQGGWKRISFAVVAYAIAGVVGWPFAVLLGVPLVVEQLCVRGTMQRTPITQSALWAMKRARNFGVALALGASIAIPVVLVDSAAYQKLVIVPLNIIRYNLFPVAGAGPELYGTEPWYFYILNGLINFNILFPLALVAPLLILVTLRVDPKRFGDARDVSKEQTHPATSLAIRLAPLHLYLAVLMLQKHKEERFLFPAYGHVVLNAAVGLYLVRGWVEAYFLKVTQSPYRATRTGLFSHLTRAVIIFSGLLSFARISALHNYYHAPFNAYHHLQNYELSRVALIAHPELAPAIDPSLPHADFAALLNKEQALDTREALSPLNLRLCLGKEWHRFPSSWLVPDEVETRWIQSAFDGIMPAVWEAPGKGKGLFGRATATVPEGMNMFNKAEEGRFVDPSTCSYLIDLDFPQRPASSFSPLEPRYAVSDEWERVSCHPFLDAENSPRLQRAIDLPIPGWTKSLRWGDYCLLRRKGLLEEVREKV
ncbi:hypothetical protein JCM9279_002129 [Rhodotorula babjevae]